MSSLTRWLRRRLAAVGVEVTRGPRQVLIRWRRGRPKPAPEWAAAQGLRLNLGCGEKPYPGYLNIDAVALPGVDLVATADRLPMLPDGCACEIRLEAVFEHLYRWERPDALAEWHRLLSPGGRLRIDWIPDFEAIARLYLARAPGLLGPVFDLEHVYRYTHGLPTPFNAPHQLHKDVFTEESVRAELDAAGFVVDSIDRACFEDEVHAINLNVRATRP